MPPSSSTNQSSRTRILLGITAISILILVVMVIRQRFTGRRPETPVYKTGPIVNCIAFSLDRNSKYVASAMSDGRVRLWEVETKRELPVKLPSRLALHDLAWNTEGILLTGGFEQHVLTWNVKIGQAKKLPMFPAQIVSIACRTGRGELLVSLANGELRLIDSGSNEQVKLTSGHNGIVKVVRFSPKGATFVTGGVDGQLIWHDWKTRQITRKIAAHQHEISSLGFSEDGQRLVTGSWDQTAKVWDENSDKPKSVIKQPSEVAQVAWMGIDIVTSCWDENLRVWNAETGSEISETTWNHGSLAFAVRPGKREVIGIDADGNWHYGKP